VIDCRRKEIESEIDPFILKETVSRFFTIFLKFFTFCVTDRILKLIYSTFCVTEKILKLKIV
tara:strand:- start:743 stop:928 length:186 start_codon:yes stop_codon:yes gene_type:complete